MDMVVGVLLGVIFVYVAIKVCGSVLVSDDDQFVSEETLCWMRRQHPDLEFHIRREVIEAVAREPEAAKRRASAYERGLNDRH